MRSEKKSKSFWKQTKMKSQQSKTYGTQQGSPEREVHNNTGLPKKNTNISNEQPNPTPTGTRGTTTKTTQSKKRKEITKIKAELNDIETKSTIVRINESRCWFCEKVNKIEKPLSRLFKKKIERTQINTIRNERGETTTDSIEIQKIVRNYYEELYVKKFENLGEMEHF